MRIYEIEEEIQKVLDAFEQGIEEAVNEETGEVKSLADYLEELNATKETKINNLGCYCKNTQYLIDGLKAEKKNLDERMKVAQKKLDSAMEYLKTVTEGKKYETPQFTVSYRKSQSVEIKDGADIPPEFLVPQEPKADKKALKKAMKDGAVFEGISLVEKVNMSVK
jgi:hypothetical protein